MGVKYYIGIDLGGTSLRAVRIDRAGQVYAHASLPTAVDGGPRAVVEQMAQLVDQVSGGAPREEIAGVGVGSPGPLDPYAGMVLLAPNLKGWVDIPLREMLHQRLGMAVELNNDGNVAALGEWHLGSGKGCRDFIYVGIGTGIGGGIIAEGQLLMGRKGMGAEVGHMQVAADGPRCSCGGVGCWESFASGLFLARYANQALEAGRPSLLQEAFRRAPVGVPDVLAAADAGDGLAQELLYKEGEYLGRGLASLLHLFSPERFALGGGVARGMKWFEEPIRRAIAERAMPSFRDVPVEYARLGERSGVIGAATLLFESNVAH